MIEYENLGKLNEPFIDNYRESFENLLKSGWYILGKEVEKFENNFAAYCQTRYCVGVANGLDALTLALKVFQFKIGSEVIVPSNTYIATVLSVLNSNLQPVLAEPNPETYNIDPREIEKVISKNTVAIIPVHLYGKMCQMDEINALAKKYNLKVIEDCAQAHGAKFKGRKAGSFGDFGAFSFYPTKNLGALGDAGCLNTDSEILARAIRMFRNYGSEKKYHNEVCGINSRLDEIQATFLNVKLAALEMINGHKRKLAQLYNEGLKQDFIKPKVHEDFQDVYHIYPVRHPKRDDLKDYLLKNGIKSEIHYPVPPNKQKAMAGILDHCHCPISEEIHTTILSLPISLIHTETEIRKIIEIMNKF